MKKNNQMLQPNSPRKFLHYKVSTLDKILNNLYLKTAFPATLEVPIKNDDEKKTIEDFVTENDFEFLKKSVIILVETGQII